MGLAVCPLHGDSEDWDQYLEEPVCAPLLVSGPTAGSFNDHQETLRNSDVLGATEFLPCSPKCSVGRKETAGIWEWVGAAPGGPEGLRACAGSGQPSPHTRDPTLGF